MRTFNFTYDPCEQVWISPNPIGGYLKLCDLGLEDIFGLDHYNPITIKLREKNPKKKGWFKIEKCFSRSICVNGNLDDSHTVYLEVYNTLPDICWVKIKESISPEIQEEQKTV